MKITLLALLSLFLTNNASAEDTLASVFRPRIGLGTGTMGYYGEIQNYQKSFTPTVNKIGGLVYVNAPFTRFFNVEMMASYGKVASNERSLYRNLNFESRIRSLSLNLYYNFWPMVNYKTGKFNPFVGVGITSLEFLSKTDLYDRQGRMYHYWSDGSIRSLAETDPNASDALYLYRDYDYETDLRSLDADGLGKYREQSFGFPFTAGMEFHLSPRWDFRLATTWTLTLTDLIDNISPAGTGVRQGDNSKDRLLFTYVSLSYDLQLPDKDTQGDEEGIEFFADWDTNDWDKDGVIDALDDCPGTPLEAKVDSSGCPLDSDQDGVPDFLDDEKSTPLGNYVDEFGVTITEEQFQRHLELYYDSTGYLQEFTEIRTVVNSGKADKHYRKDPLADVTGKNYVIVMGAESKDITANDLHKFLGFADFQTVVKNDTVYYIMGEYNSIQDAVAAKTELEKLGIEVENVATNNTVHNIINPVDSSIISKVENINKEEGYEGPDLALEETTYMVQIGAFSKPVDVDKVFPNTDNVYFAAGKDGITRYYTGKYDNWDDAKKMQDEMHARGYPKAFVVAYEKGERITLKEAGVKTEQLPSNYDETKEIETFVDPKGENPLDNTDGSNETDTTSTNTSNIINGINMDNVRYRVKLGTYEGEIPIEVFNIYSSIGGIKTVKNFDGSTSYYSRQFNTEEERDAAIKEYESYELVGLLPTTEYDGEFYTPEEFKQLLGQ
ncbi:MAG: outer membrane beta-barrel protein [Crocinitomicaceae bacterium]|nr:outer membrane beta-barrel protein [Crocinitomicaceae bacterium]